LGRGGAVEVAEAAEAAGGKREAMEAPQRQQTHQQLEYPFQLNEA